MQVLGFRTDLDYCVFCLMHAPAWQRLSPDRFDYRSASIHGIFHLETNACQALARMRLRFPLLHHTVNPFDSIYDSNAASSLQPTLRYQRPFDLFEMPSSTDSAASQLFLLFSGGLRFTSAFTSITLTFTFNPHEVCRTQIQRFRTTQHSSYGGLSSQVVGSS